MPSQWLDNQNRLAWILATALTLLVLGLHVAFWKHAGGFWRDEVNTLNVAEGASLSQMADDSFPVLMPCLVRAWSSLGLAGSDPWLRLLGLLIGLSLLAALWVLVWLTRRSPPLLSLVLVGLNGTVLVYSDSLRAFGLGSLLLALTMAAMCAFLRRPAPKQTIWLSLAAMLAAQALYSNTLLLAALWLGGWAIFWQRQDRPAAFRLLAASLPSAVSLLPYWSKVLPLLTTAPASGVGTLRSVFRPGLAWASLNVALGSPLSIYLWVLSAVVLAGLTLATAFGQTPRSRVCPEPCEWRLFASVALLAATVLFGSFLWFARLRTEPWYFLPLLVLAALCFELGWPQLRGPLQAGWLALVLLLAITALPSVLRAVQWRFTNVDLVAEKLVREASPQDFVLVVPWNRGISFERYFRCPMRWTTVPPLVDHRTHRYDLVLRQTQTPDVLRPIFEAITNTLASGHRVWVVGQLDIPRPGFPLPADLPPPPLKYTGWSSGPYLRNWTDQLAQFLSNHSGRFALVALDAHEQINENERLNLFVAQGWLKPD